MRVTVLENFCQQGIWPILYGDAKKLPKDQLCFTLQMNKQQREQWDKNVYMVYEDAFFGHVLQDMLDSNLIKSVISGITPRKNRFDLYFYFRTKND